MSDYLSAVEREAAMLLRAERMVEVERTRYAQAVKVASLHHTQQEIADASAAAGRPTTRQRISQIIKD